MTQNPSNSVVITGHSNGTISMWTPNFASEPVVKILTHPCSVTNVQTDVSGKYLYTTEQDKKLKIWDLRNDYTEVFDYYTPNQAQCMTSSQKGLLALGYKGSVEVWKDLHKTKQQKPYIKHHFADKQIYANDMKFINFEDFLGIGTNKGYSQIVIPGSGEANYDTYENNLFETKNQKKNSDVKKLLEKIPYTMIGINSDQMINKVNMRSKSVIKHHENQEMRNKTDEYVKSEKKKMRLSNKAKHELILKENHHIEANKKKFKNLIEKNHEKINVEKVKIKDELNILDKVDDEFDPEANLNDSFSNN
jgi:U3 small nucleolar RNA-associated protein 7